MVVLVLLGHLASRCGRQTQYLLLAGQAQEEHRQASHGCHCCTGHANPAGNGSEVLAGGSSGPAYELRSRSLSASVHALVLIEHLGPGDCQSSRLGGAWCWSPEWRRSSACRCWTLDSSGRCSRRSSHRRSCRFHQEGLAEVVPDTVAADVAEIAAKVGLEVFAEVAAGVRSVALHQQSMALEAHM